MRFLFLALTLSSSVVLAQTTTGFQLTIPNQVGDTLTLGGPGVDCGLQRNLNWSLNTGGTACSELNIWVTTAESCPDAPTSGSDTEELLQTVSQGSVATTRTGTPDFALGELPGLDGADPAVVCGQPGQRREYRVCGAVKLSNSGFGTCDITTTVKAEPVVLVYDTEAPPAPGLEVSELDSALSVRVNGAGGDPTRFRVVVLREGQQVASETQTAENSLFQIQELENGVTYDVQAYAIDLADNESAASEPAQGTPVKTFGFMERYTAARGAEEGGCNTAGGGLVGSAVLAALAFWLSSRRNRS